MISSDSINSKLYTLKQRILLLFNFPNPTKIMLHSMYNRAARVFVRIETITTDLYWGYLSPEDQNKLNDLVSDERLPEDLVEADTLIAELIVWTMTAKHALLEKNLVVKDNTLVNVDPRSMT